MHLNVVSAAAVVAAAAVAAAADACTWCWLTVAALTVLPCYRFYDSCIIAFIHGRSFRCHQYACVLIVVVIVVDAHWHGEQVIKGRCPLARGQHV